MNPSLYSFHCTEEVATFWLTDMLENIVGYTSYRPSGEKKLSNDKERGKYFHYLRKGRNGVFGTESLHNEGAIYLVGGMFKAATLHRLGYASLHVSSSSYHWLIPQLSLLGRKFFAVGDSDLEGKQFVGRYGGFVSPVDVDEMSDGDIHRMILRDTINRNFSATLDNLSK